MPGLTEVRPGRDERERVLDMLDACNALVADARVTVHLAAPVPKARARKGRGGHYTPERTRAAEDLLTYTMRRLGRIDGNAALACVFYAADLTVGDGDNLLKLVADAGTKANVWRDDKQITGWAAQLELDRGNPRTVIAVAPHVSTLKRHLTVVR